MIDIEKLRDLKRLKDNGVISDDEFMSLKKEELSKYFNLQGNNSQTKTSENDKNINSVTQNKFKNDNKTSPTFNKSQEKRSVKKIILIFLCILLIGSVSGLAFYTYNQLKKEAEIVKANKEAKEIAMKAAAAEKATAEKAAAEKVAAEKAAAEKAAAEKAAAEKALNNKRNYKTVKIGNLVWMKENLDVSFFRNGDLIPHVKSNSEWKNANKKGKPAWCYYNNSTSKGKKYGKLYNWYAVNDSRGLAPKGWHVATDKEWFNVIKLCGGEDEAGTKLKSSYVWTKDGSHKASNESGFTALPGGNRDASSGRFYGTADRYGNRDAHFWSSSERKNSYSGESWSIGATVFQFNNSNGMLQYVAYEKGKGCSVRCVKN